METQIIDYTDILTNINDTLTSLYDIFYDIEPLLIITCVVVSSFTVANWYRNIFRSHKGA